MKKLINIAPALLLLALLLNACAGGGNKRNADFIPPMTIEIADEIKGDTELVEMIQSSEKAINEFSDNIEQLAVDGKDFIDKSNRDEETSVMEKLKAGKMMLEFASNSTQMINTMEKFTNYMESKESQGIINDEQLKALEQVGTAFNRRIEEVNKKYADYFDE